MQRIPNPVSDLNIFLRVFREIYALLKDFGDFGLDDISRSMIAKNNVTSQGAIGDEALRRSTRKDRSLDPIYNQSKMYAELFRTLGWIHSKKSKLTYTFSMLGHHVALAQNADSLLRECLLGIAYPNEVLQVKGNQKIRVISGILLVMNALGSISRDEMIAGPLSISDDSDLSKFQEMIDLILRCRQSTGELDRIIDLKALQCKIRRRPTMENYTRFPLAAFPWSGWGVKKSPGVIHITSEGKLMAERLLRSPDIRLSNFNVLPDKVKPVFIRWTFYSMLERAGFNMSSVFSDMETYTSILERYGLPSSIDVFFSPFQQLSRESIKKWTPELVQDEYPIADETVGSLVEPISGSCVMNHERTGLIFHFSQYVAEAADYLTELVEEIQQALNNAGSVTDATDSLLSAYGSANKDVFYPLVAKLFCVLSFDCRVSRAGQNYERADAIIFDMQKSIPIEIKSPGEESEISVKGIRQALENKIVLLSRKNYPTDPDVTSLVVGFNPPNDRSEVHELIKDIRKAFNVRIGVIDLRTLLFLAVHTVHTGKKINIENFYLLQGVISVRSI